MRNLWQFILKYSNLLLFLLLEAVALFFVFSRNGLPHSAWRSSANYVVGSFYQTWSNVSDYFFLRSENERLVAENVELQNYITRLENQLEGLFESQLPDTVPAYVYAEKDLRYIPAKVINFSTSSPDDEAIGVGLYDMTTLCPNIAAATLAEAPEEPSARRISA